MIDVKGLLVVYELSHNFHELSTSQTYITKSGLLGALDEGILIYENEKMRFIGKSKFERKLAVIDGFETSSAKFITIKNRSILKLYDCRSAIEHVITLIMTEDIVRCFGLSETFHVLCIATNEGMLRYYSLRTLHQRQVVKMPLSAADKLVITPSWGFVAVSFRLAILLFTINGAFLSKYEHECPLVYWNAVASSSDFDFIVMADIQGNLVVLEAARPENRVKLTRLLWPVCCIVYQRQIDTLAVISTNGKVMLITHPFSAVAGTQ
jgi:hypothetical protein